MRFQHHDILRSKLSHHFYEYMSALRQMDGSLPEVEFKDIALTMKYSKVFKEHYYQLGTNEACIKLNSNLSIHTLLIYGIGRTGFFVIDRSYRVCKENSSDGQADELRRIAHREWTEILFLTTPDCIKRGIDHYKEQADGEQSLWSKLWSK